MAACVAVISNMNNLLYLRTSECPDPLFYHVKANSALDVIEDKLSKRAVSGTHDQLEQYLGLLYSMEDHRLYGYVTNTKVKFIMIFETQAQALQSTPHGSQSPSPTNQTNVNVNSSMTNNNKNNSITTTTTTAISSSSNVPANMVVTSNATPNQTIPNPNNNPIGSPHRDAEIRHMFHQLHKAYVDLVCCPFYQTNSTIDPDKSKAAKRFEQSIVQNLMAKQASSGYCTTLTHLINQSKSNLFSNQSDN